MAVLTDYNTRGLKIVTPEPLSGTAGQALNDNFKAIAGKLDFTPSSLTALTALDMGTFNVTNVGTVDGIDVSAVSLSSMPTAAAADINCGAQNITNVGNVDGKDVSTLIDSAGAITAIESEATLEFDAATVISTAVGELGLTTTGTDAIDITAGAGLELDSGDTSNLTMTANAAVEKTLTVKSHNNDATTAGHSKLLLTATKTNSSAAATVSVAGDIVTIAGQIRYPYRAVSAAADTILATDSLIGADSTSNVVLFTLPLVSAVAAGVVITVKDIGGAAVTNNITVQRAGSDAVDGGTSTIISANYGSVRLFCNGAAWFII
jgi:hypothetical protein